MATEKQDPKPVTAVMVPAAPPQKPPTPFFEEVAKLDEADKRREGGGGEKHTFGEWARAKGVSPAQVRDAIREKKMSAFEGDGPEMTEAEFEKAVDFRLQNSFGELPLARTHIPAEIARGTAPGEHPPADDTTPRRKV